MPAQDDVGFEHAVMARKPLLADKSHLFHDGRELVEPIGENNVAFVVAAIPERVLDARKNGPALNFLDDLFVKIFRGDADVCVHIDAVIVLRKYNPGVHLRVSGFYLLRTEFPVKLADFPYANAVLGNVVRKTDVIEPLVSNGGLL